MSTVFNKEAVIKLIDDRIEQVNAIQILIDKENEDNLNNAMQKRKNFTDKACAYIDSYNKFCCEEFFNCGYFELKRRRKHIINRYPKLSKNFTAADLLSVVKSVSFDGEHFIYDDTIFYITNADIQLFADYLEERNIERVDRKYQKKRFSCWSLFVKDEYVTPIDYLTIIRDYCNVLQDDSIIPEYYVNTILQIHASFKYEECEF